METVSINATMKRVNRKLAHEEKRLCISRPRERFNLGDLHLVCRRYNAVIDSHCDLEKLARELGVLSPEESVAL